MNVQMQLDLMLILDNTDLGLLNFGNWNLRDEDDDNVVELFFFFLGLCLSTNLQ